MTRRLLRRGLIAAVGIGAVAAASTAAAAPDPVYPNLPAVPSGDQLQGALTDTIGYVPPSRQWVRVPRVMLAADAQTLPVVAGEPPSAYCVQQYGVATCTPAPDAYQRFVVNAHAYPIDVATPATQSRFTDFPAATVRTVAFGSIPVEATIHLSLPTGGDGLPQGLDASAVEDWYKPDKGPDAGQYVGHAYYHILSDSVITGRLQVRLSDLSVDGVPVDVGSACHTNGPASLDGQGIGYTSDDTSDSYHVPPGTYNPRIGGTITGTLDMPKFTGCGVGGDNLDALVSAMASGRDFPVKIEQGLLGSCWASPPSAIEPGTCPEPEALPFPARGSH